MQSSYSSSAPHRNVTFRLPPPIVRSTTTGDASSTQRTYEDGTSDHTIPSASSSRRSSPLSTPSTHRSRSPAPRSRSRRPAISESHQNQLENALASLSSIFGLGSAGSSRSDTASSIGPVTPTPRAWQKSRSTSSERNSGSWHRE